MNPKPALIYSSTLFGYAEVADNAGINARELLQEVGIDEQVLQGAESLIPLQAMCDLLELSSARSGWEDFGLHLAARRRLVHFGQVGAILRESPTGLAALQTLCRYLQLVNPCLSADLEISGKSVWVRQQLQAVANTPVRQSIEMAVGVLHGVLRELLGQHWRASKVCFMHRAPKSRHYARQLFDCTIEYNAPFNGLICDISSLSHQLAGRDAAWAQYSKQQLDARLSHIVSTVTAQARHLMLLHLPQGRCTAPLIAQQLNITSRTLHRQLAREQTTYINLLTTLRRELVMQLLISSDHSAIEIAQQLGFANGSVFAHWFHKQFNTTVKQWRTSSKSV